MPPQQASDSAEANSLRLDRNDAHPMPDLSASAPIDPRTYHRIAESTILSPQQAVTPQREPGLSICNGHTDNSAKWHLRLNETR
jgi:hypothetical protein